MNPEFGLAGKVAIVSGGAHGLGRAMTLALEAQGASVYVPDVNREFIAALARETSERVIAEHCDVSDETLVARAVARCIELFGHIDVLVNNAGPTAPTLGRDFPKHFWEVDSDLAARFVMAHALGSFMFSKAVVPHLFERGWGRIVTVTTSHRTMIGAGRVPYGPAKAAMEAYAAVMARDLEGSSVTVNVLIPGGSVATYPGRDSMSGAPQLQPEVMASPMVWLASERSDGVSGRRIIASRWDEAVSGAENLTRASAPIGWPIDSQF